MQKFEFYFWCTGLSSCLITHSETQSVGVLWTCDCPVGEVSTYTTQTQEANIHASSGIWTRSASKGTPAVLCLRAFFPLPRACLCRRRKDSASLRTISYNGRVSTKQRFRNWSDTNAVTCTSCLDRSTSEKLSRIVPLLRACSVRCWRATVCSSTITLVENAPKPLGHRGRLEETYFYEMLVHFYQIIQRHIQDEWFLP